jgi:hypothetical protein
MAKRYEVMLSDELVQALSQRFPGMSGAAAIRQCVVEAVGEPDADKKLDQILKLLLRDYPEK